MKLENYLRYLQRKKKLRKETCCSIGKILTRFHSFLDEESVSDLAAVDAGLLERYVKTLQNVAPSTLRDQLTIIYHYLARVATRRSDRLSAPEAGSRVASTAISPARPGSTTGNQGDSLYWHFKSVVSSLSQSNHRRGYIPTFNAIRSVIETARNNERTQSIADLGYVVASSGLRMGELASLRITDVVSDMGLACIESKGTPFQRYVPLSPRAIQSLKSLHNRFAGSDMVFGDRSRAYLSGLYHRFQVLAVSRGIEQMRMHSLRIAALGYLDSLAQTSQEQSAVQYLTGRWNPLLSDESDTDISTILQVATRLLASLWAKLECDLI